MKWEPNGEETVMEEEKVSIGDIEYKKNLPVLMTTEVAI